MIKSSDYLPFIRHANPDSIQSKSKNRVVESEARKFDEMVKRCKHEKKNV